MWPLLLLAFVAVMVLLLVGAGLWLRRRRRVQIATRAWTQWERLPAIADPSRRILEAENILDETLRSIGYRGTFGEKLQKMQKTLPNIDAVWHAHKLRNRIAHEPGVRIGKKEAAEAISTFRRVLQALFPL